MKRKKIIKFYGVGYKDINQAYVIISSLNGNIIYAGKTYNGCVSLYLNNKTFYKITSIYLNKKIQKTFYVNDSVVYTFSFNDMNRDRHITLLLKDDFYNLLIERGNIILWQE